MNKKIMALVVSIIMLVSFMSTVAFAAEGDVAEVNGTGYSTLKDAILNANEGDTVKLLASYEDWRSIQVGKTITIDLNGYNINRTFGGLALDITDGTVTVTGTGKISGATSGANVADDAALVIGEGVTVEGRDGHGIENKGVLTINGATVTGTEYGVAQYEGTLTMNSGSVSGTYGIAAYTDTVVTVNNGTVTGTTAGISGHGQYHGTKITIAGGTIQSETGVGVYHPQNGTLNISGGTIKGATGINVKSGTVNITGGEIIGTGEESEYSFVSGGFAPTGDAIVIESCNYPGGAPSVSISGGAFTSDNADAVASYIGNNETETVTDFITGGTFSTDVTDYVKEDGDAEVIENEDGTVDVGVPVKVTVTVTPENGGTATGAGTFVEGKEVTVTATVAEGYEFAGWYIGDVLVSEETSYTFKAEEDTALTAQFEKEEVVPDEEPKDEPKDEVKNPPTDENNAFAVWAVLFTVSAVAVIAIAKNKVKFNEK